MTSRTNLILLFNYRIAYVMTTVWVLVEVLLLLLLVGSISSILEQYI